MVKVVDDVLESIGEEEEVMYFGPNLTTGIDQRRGNRSSVVEDIEGIILDEDDLVNAISKLRWQVEESRGHGCVRGVRCLR
jgi:hypothetical protein